ncbi:MAG: EAL domain-containing protein [Candidatus Thiodiazotropha sp.]
MHHRKTTPTDPPDFEANLKRRQIELAYAGLPAALAAIMINATIITIAQWQVIRTDILVFWYLSMLLLTLYRLIGYRSLHHQKPNLQQLTTWGHRAITNSLMSGFIWGSAAFLLVPLDHQVHQTIIIATLIGMAAGGVITQASLLPASIGFLLLVLVPLVIRLFMLGGSANIGLGIMTSLFIVIMATGAVRIHRNLTQSLELELRQQHSRRIIEHLAYHDALTNLPNRRLLIERLSKDIVRSKHHKHHGALLFLDLDNFKNINDSLGHQQGDELLKQMAHRLNRCLRDEDTAVRLGGDEFVLLMPELADSQEIAVEVAMNMAREVQKNLGQSFSLNGEEIHMAASIGVALFPTHGDNADDLLKRADYAMYQAKAIGRNTISLYRNDMQEQANLLMSQEQGLRNALKNCSLVLQYQPLVTTSGILVGAEALVRWRHPEKGLIAPDEFIQLAEQSGLIIQLGQQVLEQVCQHINELFTSGLTRNSFRISINVSPLQFASRDFVSETLSTVTKYAIDPTRLILEVTENVLLQDIRKTVSKLDQLRRVGFTIAIDDFGTGHSSLAYLKQLPIDTIKIDRILVKDITREETDAVIVEGTIRIAKKLGINVVAEGVEDQRTLERLAEFQCDIIQGDLIAKPMDIEVFRDYLKDATPV